MRAGALIPSTDGYEVAKSKNRGGELIARREKSNLVELGVHS